MLKQIPQDAEFHPEGDVWTHTHAVRRSLDEALALLPGFSIDENGRNILRLAAWCHDLGKSTATLSRENRWISPGHEKSKYLNRALRRLGPPWRKMWLAASIANRKNFVYVCTRHMAMSDTNGIDPYVIRSLRSNDPQRTIRAKLAILLMVMDRLGTTRASRIEDALMVVNEALKMSNCPSSTT